MDELLKAFGLILYILLSPLFTVVEFFIVSIKYINYSILRIAATKTKLKKHMVSLLRHRPHFPWSFKQG